MKATVLFILALTSVLFTGCEPPPVKRAEITESAPESYYLNIRIPGNIMPDERYTRFESPLELTIAEQRMGEIVGRGSQLAEGGGIEYCDIALTVYDLKTAMSILSKRLRELNAPKGTLFQTIEGKKVVNHPLNP